MNTSEVDALFAQTLLGDYHSEAAWDAVGKLRMAGNREIFERAAAWSRSDDPLKRSRGIDVLCQLYCPRAANTSTDPLKWEPAEKIFQAEAYSIITKIVESERDPAVLDSAIHALGHLENPDAVPLILRYLDHVDEDIRFAVAFALGCYPNHAQSVSGLLQLTSDVDADVRDWAVFGLGVQGDADSPEIREALLRCLDDASLDVREEAAVGLGKRRDQRLLPKLRIMLDESVFDVRLAEAAAALLGMEWDPPGWTLADYKAALGAKIAGC